MSGGWITTLCSIVAIIGSVAWWQIRLWHQEREAPPPEHSNAYRAETFDQKEIVKARPTDIGAGC